MPYTGGNGVRFGQWISLIALLISLFILWKTRQILLLVFAAVVLATVLNRVVCSLQQAGMRRGLAIALTIILLLLTVFSFFAIIVPKLVQQVDQLIDVLPLAFEQLRLAYDWLQARIPGQILVGWIKGTLIAMGVVGSVSYIGLLILGVPLPLVNGLLAGLLEPIPNVGPTVSVLPPVLLALLDAPWKAIAVIVLYLLIQQFESLVLIPYVMKREVSLLPLFTILSVVVFSLFFGFLGLFLAIPLLIVV